MNTRSSRSMVSFSHSFALPGYSGELPAGDYEILVEEELLQELSFVAYRRTATYLLAHGTGGQPGRIEMRKISETDLEAALGRDRAPADGA